MGDIAMDSESDYQRVREEVLSYYNSIHSVFSPVFQSKVFFSAEGFNHIVYKNARSERERSSQVLRFKLLSRAVELLTITTTYQEYEEKLQQVIVKRYKKKAKEQRAMYYWGIIAIVKGRKIKVIVRKIGDNGGYHLMHDFLRQ